MLWRRRRHVLGFTYVVVCLCLIPAYLYFIWAVSDGPIVLAALGVHSALPGVNLSNGAIALGFVGFCAAGLQAYRLIYDMRAQAIAGDVDAIPPAKPLLNTSHSSYTLPITLVWRRTRQAQARLLIWFILSGGTCLGLLILAAQFGIFASLSSLQPVELWAVVGLLVFCFALLALLPFALLRALMRHSQGVVADASGISKWSKRNTRVRIAWSNARLIEVRDRKSTSTVTRFYTCYAADGTRLEWRSVTDDPKQPYRLAPSRENDSEQRAAAILELAHGCAGLTPHTFFASSVDHSSNLASMGNVLLSKDSVASLNAANMAMVLGATAGCGAAALAVASPFGIAPPLVGATLLMISTSWALVEQLAQALTKPVRLKPDQRPHWSVPTSLLEARSTQIAQVRNLRRNWTLGIRGALLFVGSGLCLTAFIFGLIAGSSRTDQFTLFYSICWLFLTLCFAAVRLSGQFTRMRTHLAAEENGLRNLLDSRGRLTAWSDIVALRFHWTHAEGFLYTADSRRGDSYEWVSGSRSWRDEMAGYAFTADGPTVDGDTFAAIVAARTGLAPAQTF